MDYQKGLVSCVTPVYNGAKYLDAMLDSVLAQTYPSVEMILTDDGSSDCTLEIAKSYGERFAQRGFRYEIVHGPHKNAAAAINRGLKQVRGEYLIWPDGDDLLHPDSIQKRVAYLEQHTDRQCVRSMMYFFDEGAEHERHAWPFSNNQKEDLFFDLLEWKTFIYCGCYMLRSEPFFAIYPERCIPEYEVGQNYQMLLPFMYHHRCPTIPDCLYGVRLHPGSHSRQARTQAEAWQRCRGFEKLVDEIAEICDIRTFFERRRILCWKLTRRKQLAKRYGQRLAATRAEVLLFLCGRSAFHRKLFPHIKHLNDQEIKHGRQINLEVDETDL